MKEFIANPIYIANVFNDFFSTVAYKVQSKIKFSSKSFPYFLPPNIHESIILKQITEMKFRKFFLPLIAVNLLAQIRFPLRY